MEPTFVDVTSISTGEPQSVPEHWLDHPVLGADFTRTPAQKQAEKLEGPPTEAWTIAQLTGYAGAHGIDLGDAKKHGEIWAAVEATLPAGDGS